MDRAPILLDGVEDFLTESDLYLCGFLIQDLVSFFDCSINMVLHAINIGVDIQFTTWDVTDLVDFLVQIHFHAAVLFPIQRIGLTAQWGIM